MLFCCSKTYGLRYWAYGMETVKPMFYVGFCPEIYGERFAYKHSVHLPHCSWMKKSTSSVSDCCFFLAIYWAIGIFSSSIFFECVYINIGYFLGKFVAIEFLVFRASVILPCKMI